VAPLVAIAHRGTVAPRASLVTKHARACRGSAREVRAVAARARGVGSSLVVERSTTENASTSPTSYRIAMASPQPTRPSATGLVTELESPPPALTTTDDTSDDTNFAKGGHLYHLT
jgi:hypothetical protein